MSAELLRRASKKLREHAELATSGPWSRADILAWADLVDEVDAEYIALMHPPVALALAEWLDELVRRAEEMNSASCNVWPDGSNHGVAMARAILREAQ